MTIPGSMRCTCPPTDGRSFIRSSLPCPAHGRPVVEADIEQDRLYHNRLASWAESMFSRPRYSVGDFLPVITPEVFSSTSVRRNFPDIAVMHDRVVAMLDPDGAWKA